MITPNKFKIERIFVLFNPLTIETEEVTIRTKRFRYVYVLQRSTEVGWLPIGLVSKYLWQKSLRNTLHHDGVYRSTMWGPPNEFAAENAEITHHLGMVPPHWWRYQKDVAIAIEHRNIERTTLNEALAWLRVERPIEYNQIADTLITRVRSLQSENTQQDSA
jgi:hypothetical protein